MFNNISDKWLSLGYHKSRESEEAVQRPWKGDSFRDEHLTSGSENTGLELWNKIKTRFIDLKNPLYKIVVTPVDF